MESIVIRIRQKLRRSGPLVIILMCAGMLHPARSLADAVPPATPAPTAAPAALPSPAAEPKQRGRFGFGYQGGSLGIGPQFAYHIKEGLDANVITGSYSFNGTAQGSTISGTYNGSINGTALWAAVHPRNSHFGFNVGYVFRNTSVSYTGATNPNGTISIGNDQYTAADIQGVNGSIHLRSAPLLGFEYGQKWKAHPGLQFTADGGYIVGRTASVTLNPVIASGSNVASLPSFQADKALAQSKLQSIGNQLGSLFLSLGLMERF